MRRAVLMALTLLGGVAAAPGGVSAQIICVQAGSSSLQQAEGGALTIRDDGYEGSFGIGSLNPLRVGASLGTRYRGADLSLGDQVVPFGLPTDIFSAGHSFLGRGIGARYVEDDISLFAMGGTTASGFTTPYGFGARSADPVGLILLDGRVSPTLRVTSRSLYSGKATSLLGANWSPRPDFRAGLTAGTGTGDGYLATSARYERGAFAIRAAYVLSGGEFRRVVVPQTDPSELDRENLEIAFRPRSGIALTAARNRYAQIAPDGTGAGGRTTGSVNQFSASGVARGVTANAAFIYSEAPHAGGTGLSLSLGRGIGRWLRLQGSALRSDPRAGEPGTMLLGSVGENVSPRLELTQTAAHSAGTTTVSFGGNVTLDRASVGAEWQTIYLPFAATDAFRQALVLHGRIQGPGGIQANVGSYVSPDGSVRYTVYASQYFYAGEKESARNDFRMYSNLIKGVVRDPNGAPISGATLRIGKEIAYSDSRGEFFVRMKKKRDYPFEVMVNEFLTPGRYSVVSAPTIAEARPEAQAADLLVVLERSGADTGAKP